VKLGHALILAINTSILAVLFAFTTWLYFSTRSEVESQVVSTMGRAAAMTEKLARLREQELTSLAKSLATSPALRGAVATKDRDTIVDVLTTIAAKNEISTAAIMNGSKTVYVNKSGRSVRADQGAYNLRGFLGEAEVNSDYRLLIGQAPNSRLLDSWSGITDVRYAIEGSPVHNLPPEDAALAAKAPAADRPETVSAKNAYYARRASALSGRLPMTIFELKAPFWASFEQRRNSLVVLGGGLFFLGLLLSLLFSNLIEKHAVSASAGKDADWQRLLDEIESARRA